MKAWILYIVLAGIFYLFYLSSQAGRDSDGAIVSEGEIDAFHMQVHDCFNDDSNFIEEDSVELSSVAGLPCVEPHDNEVFAVFDVSLVDFPGEKEMNTVAFDSCLAHFENFVGMDYESSSLDIMTLQPTLASWQEADREIVCAVFDVDLKKLEGSMQGLSI